MSTEAETWNADMIRLLKRGFPWRASADAGRWYLYDKGGACLARFHLDSGHGSRLAASAPDLYEALDEAINYLTIYAATNRDEACSKLLDRCAAALHKAIPSAPA